MAKISLNQFDELMQKAADRMFAQDNIITAQAASIAKLEKFVASFLDNFKDCELCGGGGWDETIGENCTRCKGTGEQIDSIGILYVDLPEQARALLAEAK